MRSAALRSSGAAGFGMPGVEVDGIDFFAVHEAAREAIERARNGGGPSLAASQIEPLLWAISKAMRTTYRAPGEVDGCAPSTIA